MFPCTGQHAHAFLVLHLALKTPSPEIDHIERARIHVISHIKRLLTELLSLAVGVIYSFLHLAKFLLQAFE